MMRRLAARVGSACLVGAALSLGHARADELPTSVSAADVVSGAQCQVEGVRVLLSDAGESSYVEISARLRAGTSAEAVCTLDWSQVVLSSPGGADAAPTIAVAQTFVDHALIPPLQVADGVAAVQPREWRGNKSALVAVRWIVEGTRAGLRVEVPRATFPKTAVLGARAERRVKSARAGLGRFAELGDIAVVPQPPGAAGGVGPAGPLGAERIVVELVPAGTALELPVPAPFVTIEGFRETLPRRVLDLTPGNEDGWNEVAKRAYAAAIHGDPLVAALGMHTLAWLGSGLSLQATRIDKVAGGADTAVVPAAVYDTIGNVAQRVEKRYGNVGKLLPLGRPAVFRAALMAKPWDDPARAAAAKSAVAKLATVQPQDLTAFLVPAIVDGSAAPVAPPPPDTSLAPLPTVPVITKVPDVVVAPHGTIRARHARPRRAPKVLAAFGIVAAIAAGLWLRARTLDPRP